MKTTILSITLLLFLPLAAAAQTADEIVKKVLDAAGESTSSKPCNPRHHPGAFLSRVTWKARLCGAQSVP